MPEQARHDGVVGDAHPAYRTAQSARNATAMPCYKIATPRNYTHIPLTGYCSGIGDPPMRMFETVTSTMLAIAAQALVVGVVVSTL
ncbi:hypothetical protein U1707_05325 [Sphingomonas sp. PB2P12]|uniref:hypothetical protein n=1 Tax=Sphingomonas sandaracina TaxID=3096157 RepID=UPI002FC9F9D1